MIWELKEMAALDYYQINYRGSEIASMYLPVYFCHQGQVTIFFVSSTICEITFSVRQKNHIRLVICIKT